MPRDGEEQDQCDPRMPPPPAGRSSFADARTSRSHEARTPLSQCTMMSEPLHPSTATTAATRRVYGSYAFACLLAYTKRVLISAVSVLHGASCRPAASVPVWLCQNITRVGLSNLYHARAFYLTYFALITFTMGAFQMTEAVIACVFTTLVFGHIAVTLHAWMRSFTAESTTTVRLYAAAAMAAV